MVSRTVGGAFGGRTASDEIGLPVTDKPLILPCGNTTVWLPDGETAL